MVDLRYRSKQIMKAVERNEVVDLYSHGKLKAHIVPPKAAKKRPSVMDDPLFGYCKDDPEPPAEKARRLRRSRYAV
jgi:hypothetical protein